MKTMVIGMGEVGCCLYEALQRGLTRIDVVVDKRLTPRARQLASDFRSQASEDASVNLREMDIILSCVEGETTPAIAELITKHGRSEQVLVDFSTASAEAKRRASSLLAERGIAYIDVAIMGAIALTGAKTNMIAAGAVSNARFHTLIEKMVACGIPIKVIENSHAGDAISLKLLRSVFTKGLEALTTECLSAAEHLGVRQALYGVLSDIDQAELSKFLEMLVTTHVVHASRRRKEVERANDQLQELGLNSLMLPAVSAVFERTEQSHDRVTTPTPPTVEVALSILTRIARLPVQNTSI